jgi:hypothetical protein
LDIPYVAAIFALSFITYTVLRQFDERSTEQLAKVIDLQKHEVNPTITWLARRMDLKKAMRLTWLMIAIPVASADAYVNIGFPYGVPIFALVIGFGHVLAAANNKHVAYVVEKLGVEEFEREHDNRMRELANLRFWGKMRQIFRSDPASVLMLIAVVPLVAALGYSMVATELFTIATSPYKLLIMPINAALCFVIAMLVIQPAFALAPLIISRRYSRSKSPSNGRDASQPNATVSIEVPVSVVVKALESAQKDGGLVVKISIPVSEGGEVTTTPNGGD